MTYPKAVLISDIHYNINTLSIADKSMRTAVEYAKKHELPLIVCGDLHDTKANMRGECVEAIIRTLSALPPEDVYVLRGNHDSYNEKSDKHSLTFLEPYAHVIAEPTYVSRLNAFMVPYHSNLPKLKEYLRFMVKGATLIMHQGLSDTKSGEYYKDPTALCKDDVKYFKVISGHYHYRQTIVTGDSGVWDYVGNPYTVNFGEAEDPEKGFQVWNSDDSLTFVPLSLRKHVVIDCAYSKLNSSRIESLSAEDLVWVKIRGPASEIANATKTSIAKMLNLQSEFKLDLIPEEETLVIAAPELSDQQILDELIDCYKLDSGAKMDLKQLWREIWHTNL